MDPVLIGVLFLILLFVLMFAGIPIAFSAFIVGFFGCWATNGLTSAFGAIRVFLFSGVASYDWALIPFFVFLGVVLAESGLADGLFDSLKKWTGHWPGGLAIATNLATAILGGPMGSSTATAAVMTKIAYPQLKRFSYDGALSLAAISAAGTIAIMIPPSIPMVVYALLADADVTKVLIAGIIPGILNALLFAVLIFVIAKIKPALAPASPPAPWRERWISLKDLLPVTFVIIVLIVTIMIGFATSSEAGGLGCIAALVIAIIYKRFNWGVLVRSLLETTKYSAMILLMISGITLFSKMLTYSGLAIQITNFATMFPNPVITIILIIAVFVVMGMFVGTSGVLLIATPMFIPVVLQMGYDPIWFGIIVIMMIEVGLLSPPIAENVFVVTGIVKDVSVGAVYKSLVLFMGVNVFLVAIFFLFPQIILWLPNMLS
jgi:C4-dicarboxylate transporter, DctM subunit